ASHRPPGYVADVLARAESVGDDTYTITPEAWADLKAKYTGKVPPATIGGGPGDVVKLVLSRLGYTATAGCGCERFRRQMNQWGWWGCAITHRAEVVAWFTAKAREQGIEVDGRGVLALLRAAWREARKRPARPHRPT